MKLYISVDMEGLAGITNWKDETEDQVRFRKAMNEQVEWVLEGCEKRHQSEARRMAEEGASRAEIEKAISAMQSPAQPASSPASRPAQHAAPAPQPLAAPPEPQPEDKPVDKKSPLRRLLDRLKGPKSEE